MPRPRLPDDKRAAILADIKAGELGNREIARRHGVSPGTVTNIARASRAANVFERSQTEKATRAVVADNRAARAVLAADLLSDAQKLRHRAWSPYSYYERGREGPELVTLDLPPLREVKEAYAALGISVQRHLELERHDSTDPGEIASLLGAMFSGLQAKHGDGADAG